MDVQVFVVVLTTIGCGTGIVCTAIDKIYGERKERLKLAERERERASTLSEERMRVQELQLAELRRQNEQLQKQLDWHNKLLEAQLPPPRPEGRDPRASAVEESIRSR